MADQTLKQCRVDDENRIASAPYNFVPLPETVVEAVTDAEKELPDHDCFSASPKSYTGYFDVLLTTKSPTYVRAALTRKQFAEIDKAQSEIREKKEGYSFKKDFKNKPQFFARQIETVENPLPTPVIPGSSLRGMLRQLLEVVSYSKMDKNRVSNRKFYFRSMDTSSLRGYYQRVMNKKQISGGFYRKTGGNSVVVFCKVLTVDEGALGKKLNELHEVDESVRIPKWVGEFHQHQRVWVKAPPDSDRIESISVSKTDGWREGVFVKSGFMEGKKREFVFLFPSKNAPSAAISKQTLEKFYDEQQITKWQEEAFPKNTPSANCRRLDGYLRTKVEDEDGDPVFFLSKENDGKLEVVFLGRAQMFRIPYDYKIHDFIPEAICGPETVDLADAIWGFISKSRNSSGKQGRKAHAYASRIAVTDATMVSFDPKGLWLNKDKATVPPILAGPKPTAFQHYLVQTNSNPLALKHYSSKPVKDTVLRGIKFYWHQGKRTFADLKPLPNSPNLDATGEVLENSTQHTQMYPVNEGATFKFRLYFENLSEIELGALCWALHPMRDPESKAEDYCHSLGMGKPFGMGAVKLNATLHLENRLKRYEDLFNGEQWASGIVSSEELSDKEKLASRTKAFEEFVLKVLGLEGQCEHIYQLERIATLLKMMEWPGYPAEWLAKKDNRNIGSRTERRPNTRYMTIELEGQAGTDKNEYSKRPVLPPPSQFGDWSGGLHPYQPNWPISASLDKALADEKFLETIQFLDEVESASPLQKPTVIAVLLNDVHRFRAQVKNVSDEKEVFPCQDIPSTMKKGDMIIANVTRKKGEIILAKFFRKAP